MKNNLVVITLVALVAGGGLGFWGGVQYQKKNTEMPTPGQFQGSQQARGTGTGPTGTSGDMTGMRNGAPINGEISDIEGNTITVKTQDGSSKIVIYSDSTSIKITEDGSLSDLEVGKEVMIVGTEGSDGTVTASNISVGTVMGGIPANQ